MVILHLTDIHISQINKQSFQNRFNEMTLAISRLEKKWHPNVLCLTGDFCLDASEEEFNEVTPYINIISKKFNIPNDNIISCPGNHDLVYDQNGFNIENYNNMCKNIGFNNKETTIKGYKFFSINTCENSTPKACNYGTIKLKETSIAPNSIILFHHPPEFIENKSVLNEILSNAKIVLSGHTHVDSPVIKKYSKAFSINGVGFAPDKLECSVGCQLISVSEDNIKVKGIISKSQEKLKFESKEYT